MNAVLKPKNSTLNVKSYGNQSQQTSNLNRQTYVKKYLYSADWVYTQWFGV